MNPKLNILCIGGGISGLLFAIKAAEYAHVHLIVKDGLYNSNSYQAKGGIAAPFADNDSADEHIKDTIITGAGLCDEKAVHFMIKNARHCILELIEMGIKFTKNEKNILDLSREGGHRHDRIVHSKDETGKAVIETLVDIVRKHPNIYIYENHFVLDLIVQNDNCCGATILNQTENVSYNFYADIVVLASGGVGYLYLLNTNPNTATGDGYALAYRVGAKISNMEFLQFHPTMLYLHKREENILISEALRGAGAELKKKDGNSFMHKYHPMGSLAPRDIVTRSMIKEMRKDQANFLYLDATTIGNERLQTEFPYIYNTCKKYGIDISTQIIPIVPAAHYMCGGVVANLNGETTIPNLYAIGEVACTGVHGANRLASNSLLEGLVFADATASYIKHKHIVPHHFGDRSRYPIAKKMNSIGIELNLHISFDIEKLQSLMWDNAGIVRNEKNLETAKNSIQQYEDELLKIMKYNQNSRKYYELLNMVQAGLLIIQAALLREGSIGTHYREAISPENFEQGKKEEYAYLLSVL